MLRSVNLMELKKTLQLTVLKMERRKQKLTKMQPKKYGLLPWNVLDSQAREIEKQGKVAAMQ